MTGLSFEFFPPKGEQGAARLDRTMSRLGTYAPNYVSVTYGAGGTTADGTLEALNGLRARHGIRTAAHLCYSGVSADRTQEYADKLWRAGHRCIVALRGDAEGCEGQGFEATAEFVAALRDWHPFEIAVACYPETHPEAASPEADLDVLLAKERAGATHALSQFFFDAELFFRFVARARAHGVTIPIVPGLLPVYDIERAIAFGDKCGSPVPQWVRERFLNASRTGKNETEVAEDLIVEQVRALCEGGVSDLHLYTLNRADLSVTAAATFREFYPLAKAA